MIQLGLAGWPVSHSLSPRLHNAALKAAGLDGNYQLFPIDPLQPEKMAELINKVRKGELSGLNVTIPHKQSVIRLLDEISPTAREIGAVNTIYLRDQRLIGHNTDGQGFSADLRNKSGKLMDNSGKAIVLGSGGSAKAVVSALAGMSWHVTIAARNLTSAKQLVNDLSRNRPDTNIRVVPLESSSIVTLIDQTDLVVNTTPVGMVPLTKFSPWPLDLPWPSRAFIYDLVYNPPATLFLKLAQSQGLQAVNGLGMLVEQAALAFEIWTGVTAPRQVMYAAVSPAQ